MSVMDKVKKVTPIVIFNIVLPTVDIITDLLIIIRLLEGAFQCGDEDPDSKFYQQCSEFGANKYCSTLNNVCRPEAGKYHPFFSRQCQNRDVDDAENICNKKGHPIFAMGLLLPFLLNYFVALYCWATMKRNPKTIIFPLLNVFPQYGRSYNILMGVFLALKFYIFLQRH